MATRERVRFTPIKAFACDSKGVCVDKGNVPGRMNVSRRVEPTLSKGRPAARVAARITGRKSK